MFERTARPLKDAIDYVSSIKDAANALQNALASSFKGSVDAPSYAENLISRIFAMRVLRSRGTTDRSMLLAVCSRH